MNTCKILSFIYKGNHNLMIVFFWQRINWVDLLIQQSWHKSQFSRGKMLVINKYQNAPIFNLSWIWDCKRALFKLSLERARSEKWNKSNASYIQYKEKKHCLPKGKTWKNCIFVFTYQDVFFKIQTIKLDQLNLSCTWNLDIQFW